MAEKKYLFVLHTREGKHDVGSPLLDKNGAIVGWWSVFRKAVIPASEIAQAEMLPCSDTVNLPAPEGIVAQSVASAEVDLPDFNGAVYSRTHDRVRLSGQLYRICLCMRDGKWRTLSEIGAATKDPVASISAQLRHLRKPRFGSSSVYKRPRGARGAGLWEYQVEFSERALEILNRSQRVVCSR